MDFKSLFNNLTGHDPFPWQEALYERFVEEDYPEVCQLPTGLGKTSVIAIWMAALLMSKRRLPRRLVYVVNRRTVVDQTTSEVEKLQEVLEKLPLYQQKFGQKFAISTLRGQYADNREWSSDPSCPAVIAGTVDMIGSRLLFGGYGCGYKSRPLHAGFLGQDVLLIHDEAHLEPAFQTLLESIHDEQNKCHDFSKLQVIQLSATTRGKEIPADKIFTLTTHDYQHDYVQQRLHATKHLHLHEIPDEKKLSDRMVEIALKHDSQATSVLIFVNTVKQLKEIQKQLKSKSKFKENVEILTGTLRGLERDELVERPIFQRFLPKATAGEHTVYLVSTSAGEVGVNISAQHLVTDLSTFECMAQRFGRVNRFGKYDDSRVDVVYADSPENKKASDIDECRMLTQQLLETLHGDASPYALGKLDPEACLEAYTPAPQLLSTSDILFDKWSLTTLRGPLPGRPPLEEYLHGKSEYEPPQTKIAWREEVEILTSEILELNDVTHQDLLEEYPLKTHELLQDQSKRVFDELKKIAKRITAEDTPVWIVDDTGVVDPSTLQKITAGDADDLYHKTLLLPPVIGGLEQGVLEGNSPFSADVSYDVADAWSDPDDDQPMRQRLKADESPPKEMKRILSLKLRALGDDDQELEHSAIWNWYVRNQSSVDDVWGTAAKEPVTLHVHLNDVEQELQKILDNLQQTWLTPEIREALLFAARSHDLGKQRIDWQKGIGNPDPTFFLAKSGHKMKSLPTTHYRHELGSLIDVQELEEFQKFSPEMQDLILHVIATHHGRGRPHFPIKESYDPERSGLIVQEEVAEVPVRFARLQRRYGRWGLAYLESLLRAADALASAHPSKTFNIETNTETPTSEVLS